MFKRPILLIAISLLAFGNVNSAPIDNVCSTALMPGDSVRFNLDFIDPFGLPLYDIMLHARVGASNSDTSIILEHVDIDPYYPNTYEGSIAFENPSGTIQFYGRVEADTLVATQSYKLSANQFPPSDIYFAPLATDAIGDTFPNTPGDWLDLTGSAMTFSDSRIHCRISNVSGSWPSNNGLEFYAYAFPLVNPDSLQLSVIAMVYINIPFVMTPGLYRVNLADTSFSRLANIQSTVSGDYLYMSCNISDLTDEPDWPVWPPEAGYIATSGITITISLETPSINDYLYPSLFIPENGSLQTGSNSAPSISDNAVVFGDIGGLASCNYYDADGNLPQIRRLHFDSNQFDMGALDHIYNDSSYFEQFLPWPGGGWHYYSFHFSDGRDSVVTPVDSILVLPDGIIETPIPDEYALSQNYPNPFNANTKIDFAINERSHIDLAIYDLLGNQVRTLVNDDFEPGFYSVIWDGNNSDGQPVSSGIYYYQLKTATSATTMKMLLLR